MKALVYHGPGNKAWEDVPKPELAADTDAIIRVDATTICGTDLHILKGDVPEDASVGDLGHIAFEDMEIGATDGRGVDPDDGVGVSCELRLGNVLPCLVARSVVDECLHVGSPFESGAAAVQCTGAPCFLVVEAAGEGRYRSPAAR